MPFTETEIAGHIETLETHFWAHRRPPLHLRDKIREGQRFNGMSIELFFVRPLYQHPDQHVEEAIAKVRFIRSRNEWWLYWRRADGQWHRYPPVLRTATLEDALQVINQDPNGCFFG